MYRYFKRIAGVGNDSYIYYWKSKGLSDEKINSVNMPNHSITLNLDYHGTKARVKFNGSFLKQDNFTFNNGKVVNIYIVYEISKSFNISEYSTLENCLFGAVTMTINADINKYKYSGYGILFDRHESFSSPGIELDFGVNMSSSTKIDNRKKYILVLRKDPTQGLEHTLSAEKIYSINFTEHNKNVCLSLHYNGANTYLFVNGKEIHKLRAKDSEIVATPLHLGNFSKDWTVENMKKKKKKG